MKKMFVAAVLSIFAFSPASACNGGGNCENAPGQLKAAPAPVLGAGLSGVGLALAYGAYRIIGRRRNEVG